MKIEAMVVESAGAAFVSRSLELEEPRGDEVLVRIVGVGLCHTDLVAQAGALPPTFPAVFGHEGAGIVESIGSAVTKVVPGDRVLLTFMSCGQCPSCSADAPAYCSQMQALNVTGKRSDGSTTLRDGAVAVSGSFFGQSSFASHAIAQERNVVRVLDGVPLEVAGVLGCGVQTGAGAVLRSMDCRPGSSLLITGGGAVGMSAVMAAHARGVGRILVAERHQARREFAREFGATDLIDPDVGPLPEQVLALLPAGVDYVLDTTGVPAVLEQLPAMLARRGTFGFVAIPPAGHAGMQLPFGVMESMRKGLTLRGIIEGDSNVDAFIGELMALHLAGRFPFDRMVKTFALSAINEAIGAQHRGECVKAVLIP
jgi:aryl-alcohol dehydrogenase